MLKHLRLATFVGLLAVAAVLVGGVVPIQISYVYSDSMEPTFRPGDGYLLLESDQAAVDDIITYWSAERGDFVTHRVMALSEMGYITKGDNNPTTDQAAGYPVVPREALIGRVLTIDDRPLVIPHLQRIVQFVSQHQTALVTLFLLYGGWQLYRSRPVASFGGDGPRNVVRVHQVIVPTLLLAFVVLTGLIYLGTATIAMTYVASDKGGEAATLMTVGEPKNSTVPLNVVKTPLTTVLVETDGMTLTGTETLERDRYSKLQASVNATPIEEAGNSQQGRPFVSQFLEESVLLVHAEVPALEQPGAITTYTRVYSYPATLPEPLLNRLHAINPLAAATMSSLMVFVPVYLLYRLFYDGSQPIRLSLPGVAR